MEYKRAQYQQVTERLQEPRLRIQVIVGPRQVGKSTLIHQVLDSIQIPFDAYNADDVVTPGQTWLSMVWEKSRMKLKQGNEQERLLVIDEIHKIPNWSETVKAEWDKDTFTKTNLKVVLLGSSRMLLMQGLSESLMGRYELIRLPHWSFTEMRDAFGWTVEQYIYYGGYPGAAPYVNDWARWKQYVLDSLIEPSIAKDVIYSTRILKPQLLRQLFEIGSSYSGQLLALKKIAAQLQDVGNLTTLAGYLELLDQAGLLSGLQKYAQDKARKYNSVPKFQIHNSALRNVYDDYTPQVAMANPEVWGRFVESAIGAYLVSQAPIYGYKVYYWREGSNEVDFVLRRNTRTVAVEVKSGRRRLNQGLVLFNEQFKPWRSIVVGGDGFTEEEFLSISPGDLF